MAQSSRLPAWGLQITVLLLLWVFGAAIIGCSETSDRLRSIVYGKQAISYIEKTKSCSFSDLIPDESLDAIPYIKLGDSITLHFETKPTTEIHIEDIILNRDGTPRYMQKEVKESSYPCSETSLSVPIQAHMAALLSSNSEDYDAGKTIRGIRICYGNREYQAVIRTDATDTDHKE